MDAQLNKRITLILTLSIIVTTIVLLLHTTQFSIGLSLLACSYVVVVLIRDYILKLNLYRMAGALFIIFQFLLSIAISVESKSFIAQVYPLILVGEFTFYHTRNRAIIFTLVSYVSILLSILIYRHFPPFNQIFYILP
jgi:hypothetical protein